LDRTPKKGPKISQEKRLGESKKGDKGSKKKKITEVTMATRKPSNQKKKRSLYKRIYKGRENQKLGD